jgi:hypothetical protein
MTTGQKYFSGIMLRCMQAGRSAIALFRVISGQKAKSLMQMYLGDAAGDAGRKTM